MKPFHQYWTFSTIRGVMTLLASFAIVTIPQIASSMLSLPVLTALAVNCLATYSLLDGGVMVLLAKLLPARATNYKALYAQAAMVIATGGLLYLVAYGVLGVRSLFWIAGAQAALAGIAEYAIARDTHKEYGCLSCYATVIVLAVAAFSLPFAAGLGATGMTLALGLYVGAYGASELTLGGRMLLLEYRSEHPAVLISQAWRLEMFQPAVQSLGPETLRMGPTPLDCERCPANVLCHDDSPAGLLARVLADRQPALVRSMRVQSLLAGAALPAAA